MVARETWTGLHRPVRGRVLSGAAVALADMIGVSVLAARWALVALSFFGGVGIAIYIAAWLFIPNEGTDTAIATAALADRRTVQLVLAGASGLIVLMVCATLLGTTALLGAVSPGLVSLAGLVAVWRHAGPTTAWRLTVWPDLWSGPDPRRSRRGAGSSLPSSGSWVARRSSPFAPLPCSSRNT